MALETALLNFPFDFLRVLGINSNLVITILETIIVTRFFFQLTSKVFVVFPSKWTRHLESGNQVSFKMFYTFSLINKILSIKQNLKLQSA